MKNLRKFQLGIVLPRIHIMRIYVAFVVAPSKRTVINVKFFELVQWIKLVNKRVRACFEKIFQVNNFDSSVIKRNFNQIVMQILGVRYSVRIGGFGCFHFILLVMMIGLSLALFSKNCVQAYANVFLFLDTNVFKSLSFAGGNLPVSGSYLTCVTIPFFTYNLTIIIAPLYSAWIWTGSCSLDQNLKTIPKY